MTRSLDDTYNAYTLVQKLHAQKLLGEVKAPWMLPEPHTQQEAAPFGMEDSDTGTCTLCVLLGALERPMEEKRVACHVSALCEDR